MTKNEIVKEIGELAKLNEKAIYTHPQELVAVYDGYKGLDLDEEVFKSLPKITYDSVCKYMDTSAFISAWYHLKGNKEKRDKASHSCTRLVSSLGLDENKTFHTHIDNERYWRDAFKNSGVAPTSYKKAFFIALIIILIIAYMVY